MNFQISSGAGTKHPDPRTPTMTVLQDFAFDYVSNGLDEKLRGIEDLARCSPEDVSEEGLTGILIEDLILKLQSAGFGEKQNVKPNSDLMDKVQELVRKMPFIISYDNLNILFCVYSQRIDNQNHFDSGTAATVFFQPNAPPIRPLCNCTLQEYRAARHKTPLNVEEIYTNSNSINNTMTIFGTPPPVCQLPTGPAFITEQYMLGTVYIEEASYDGNNKLLVEWLKQLGLHWDEQQQKTGLERVIPWVGNQLIVECLQALY
ncbi:hypothetical protein SERLA73DRAFT_149162 [Serpula lacrymans var. lacrymans S7.3]|uniref:DUF6589 domain-containing protein n=1 Tax=Serpula lacrymans var. lacrymans (strain S7.3) TaxID=936435 RepID=F8PFY0_SERL3|nr:hypothetical protein SERLA73DRAFT_149162 [Serpula lacrymans var. lacrymans S7.3]